MKSFGRLSGQPGALSQLVEVLKRLPGIGQKSAQRLAFYFMRMTQQDVQGIVQAILDIKEKVSLCRDCHNISENEVCGICNDPRRDRTKILVIQDLNVLYTIEKTGDYKGLYHVLQGILSPLDGVGPDQFQVDDLIKRFGNGEVKEVIIATNPNIEGEATAIYLSKFIKDAGIQVSRIAYGIPVGMDLDYADEVTLIKALEGRRSF
ncbi:MAG TPA: recombination mediator RecR [Nitrospiria bacterium]